MSLAFEAFLARLYTDAEARAQFLASPEAETQRAGLDVEESRSLLAIDRVGLELAAASFERKRASRAARASFVSRAASLARRLLPG